jgi:hypothetical protein
MYTSETPGGRERRKHLRFQLRKGVRIIASDVTFEGTLIDISVGGAAIEYREQLENNQSFDVDIDELGIYSANLVRWIDVNVIAIQFSINEALAVRLAARIAVAYYEQQFSIGDGYELEEIEVLSVESVECA